MDVSCQITCNNDGMVLQKCNAYSTRPHGGAAEHAAAPLPGIHPRAFVETADRNHRNAQRLPKNVSAGELAGRMLTLRSLVS